MVNSLKIILNEALQVSKYSTENVSTFHSQPFILCKIKSLFYISALFPS